MPIIIEDRRLADLPLLNVYDGNAQKPLPVVIMLHGFTSCKENNLKDAYTLAKQGFFMVLFDAARHGERMDPAFQKLSYFEKARYLVEIQVQSSLEINEIISGHERSVLADWERVGLIGFSMGGNAIYKYLAQPIPPTVKAAVPLLASPCWSNSIRKLVTVKPELRQFVNEDNLTAMRQAEPDLSRLKDFPLLMINGGVDEKVSIEDVRQIYLQLARRYSERAMIRQLEYPDLAHQVSGDMINKASEWFHQYLSK